MFKQSLRMTARDWRAGELRFLLIALIVAVAALSAVGFFIDRLRTGLNRDAHQLLGADLVLRADLPIRDEWKQEARRRGLLVADTVSFPSMAQAGEGEASLAQLSSVKAVGSGYPLRGKLKITTDAARAAAGSGSATRDTPAAGTVWVDHNLLAALKVKVGQSIRLGSSTFKVSQLIVHEPDRGGGFASLAPRVMLATSELEATGLTATGARADFGLQVAAPSAAEADEVAQFQLWVAERIRQGNIKGVRIESLENSQPQMRATLDRADRFLSLVGLLSAMLAAVAVVMAARRFMSRHIVACAMLRCLGLTQ